MNDVPVYNLFMNTCRSALDEYVRKPKFLRLITQDITSPDKKIQCLQKSLIEHREHMFLFLEYENVPYENNASERAARPVKVKQN
jgi:transposase